MTGWKRKASALIMILLVFAPYVFFAGSCLAQTKPGIQSDYDNPLDPNGQPGQAKQSSAGTNDDSSSPAYETTPPKPYDHSVPSFPPGVGEKTNLAQQAAEQNMDWKVTWDLTNPLGMGNDVYNGLHQWYTDDIFDNLFAGIGQLFGKWLYEFITGWMCDVVRFLTGALATFVLNPNIANNVAQGKDDISMSVHKMADIMMSIAIDLLLLLFILCIWKYWAEANWKGMLNPMSSVMRLISTAGILLAWPTIYSFITELANQMIKALWFNTADSMAEFDQAIVTIIKAGLVDTAAGLVQALAPVMGTVGTNVGFGGWVLGAVGGTVSFAAEIIFGLLTAIIIGQLLVILCLKAVQTAILIAQYMFAPLFIVFFAVPDTEQYTVKYMYGFCMVSLWTFCWLALFRLLIIVLNSANNPWGKILLVLGVLQLMIQGPAFLSSGIIEPKLNFIDAKDIIDKVRGLPSMAGGAVGKLWNGLKGGADPTPIASTIGASSSPAFSAYNQSATASGTASTNTTSTTGGTPGTGGSGPALLGLPGPKGPGPTGPGTPGTPPVGGGTGGAGGTASFQGTGTGSPATAGLGTGPGGTGLGTPPVKQAQTPFNAAETFGPTLKHRTDMGSFVKDISEGKVGIAFSDNGQEGYVFGSKNDLNQINVAPGADPEHVGRRILVGSSASLIKDNDLAKQTAMRGSHAKGYDAPQGNDLQMAKREGKEGKEFRESAVGKFRAQEGAQRYAVEGSEAYYRNEPGNDYTNMLKQIHGEWNGDRQADADSMMVNPTRPDSPFNASYGTVGTNLGGMGIRPTAATRAAAGHSRIMSMPKSAQRTAVQAVSAHILQDAGIAALDGPDKSVAMGQLVNSFSDDQIEVITELFVHSGGTETAVFNDHINAGVHRLTNNTKMRAGQAYRQMQRVSGGRTDAATVRASVDIVEEGYHAGMSDSHLMRTQSVEVGKLAETFLSHNEPDLPREILVAGKIIGGSMPSMQQVQVVSSMRSAGWNVYDVKEHELRAAEAVLSQGMSPDRSAVLNHLSQNRQGP